MRSAPLATPRQGAAAVEMAFLMPLLLGLIVGVWEVGRLVQIQQTMYNAAREGARLASQATIINSTGAYTQITTSSSSPNVTTTVAQYLSSAGITNQTGLVVTYTDLTNPAATDPYLGAQNDQFIITVTLPYANVKWSPLSLVNPQTVGASCTWTIMIDSPIIVNTTLPTWAAITTSN
jgi:Flp pilus assembly protein TadG